VGEFKIVMEAAARPCGLWPGASRFRLDILDKLAGCLAPLDHRRPSKSSLQSGCGIRSRAGSEHLIATRLDDADHVRRICGGAGIAVS
jgi:hypothetical protein